MGKFTDSQKQFIYDYLKHEGDKAKSTFLVYLTSDTQKKYCLSLKWQKTDRYYMARYHSSGGFTVLSEPINARIIKSLLEKEYIKPIKYIDTKSFKLDVDKVLKAGI